MSVDSSAFAVDSIQLSTHSLRKDNEHKKDRPCTQACIASYLCNADEIRRDNLNSGNIALDKSVGIVRIIISAHTLYQYTREYAEGHVCEVPIFGTTGMVRYDMVW